MSSMNLANTRKGNFTVYHYQIAFPEALTFREALEQKMSD
jgi:hypothetical protein